jgi:integrase
MATVKFFIRTKKKSGKLTPILARLKAGTEIDLTAKTGLTVMSEHWNSRTSSVRIVADALEKDDINKTLRELSTHILNSVPADKNVPAGWLPKVIDQFHNPQKPRIEKTVTLFSFIQDFIDKAPTRPNPKTGRPVCYKMIREYERTFYYLKEYAKKKRRKIDFENITLDFYHDFNSYLTKLDLATNTIGKKIQTLKIFLNAATDAGVNAYTQYKSHRFTAISEETENIHLNVKDLQKMFELDLSKNHRLEKVRDLFLIGAWTGLRFSDWSQVSQENIEDGLLIVKQSKTGGKVWIPLHPMVEYIINKYDGLLPDVPSNQKFNDYIKEVGELTEINEPFKKSITKGGVKQTTVYKKWELVSTHTARRSFATNAYNVGVPSLTIMAITGHKTETSFLKYIKVTPKEHALKLKDFWQKSASANAFNMA